MNHRILILSAIVLAVVFSSCKKMFEDEELSMERTNYTGTELRTDGYYYYRNRYVFYDGEQLDQVKTRILYRNGVAISTNIFDYLEMGRVEDNFKNGNFYNLMKNSKCEWKVYKISNGEIEFEGWTCDCVVGYKHSTYREYGEIINDTTFRLIKECCNGKVTEYSADVIYHFKQFSPKPDSTNSFIK